MYALLVITRFSLEKKEEKHTIKFCLNTSYKVDSKPTLEVNLGLRVFNGACVKNIN